MVIVLLAAQNVKDADAFIDVLFIFIQASRLRVLLII